MMPRSSKPRPVPRQAAFETSRWRYAVPAAIGWLILFAVFFFTRPLQNNGQNGQLDRATLALLLPELTAVAADDGAVPSGVQYLPQRLDLIATAGFIAAGAWGLGGLLLRLIEFPGRGATGAASAPSDHRTGGAPTRFIGLERLVVAFGLGLSTWSLLTLAFGLAGWLSRGLFVGVLLVALIGEVALSILDRASRASTGREVWERPSGRFVVLCLATMLPFLIAAALAAMLPPFDFDVKEYHLGGPKEWYLGGRVHFLPHNVYTSFPFLTEMLSLTAMVVRGDWFRGALAGQLLLAAFLPLTAAAVFATGRRLFGTTAGLLGAVVYVTTPWAYRVSVIAYSEGGLSCYLALSLFAVVVAIQRLRAGEPVMSVVLLAGFFAGSAMACKYPGVVQVVIPAGLVLLWPGWRSDRSAAGASADAANSVSLLPSGGKKRAGEPIRIAPSVRLAAVRDGQNPDPPRGRAERIRNVAQTLAVYSLGVLLAIGPWLVKNAVETRNPVYPLMWTVFDGLDWDADLNAKWRAAHGPPHYDPKAFFTDAVGVVASSDWQSLLVFGLAPLALLASNRRAAAVVWAYVGYLYAAWWLLTHRIDRFWVPLLPVACVLAGAGAAWAEDLPRRLRDADLGVALRWIWRAACGVAFAGAVLFNLVIDTSSLTGNPSYLADLGAVSKAVETPSMAALNELRRGDGLAPNARVLLVGEAEIFDARVPVLYNTVFDHNLFEQWTARPQEGLPKDRWSMRPVEQIRQAFADRGVTHIAVNWREVLRYRMTYGFTSYVTRERFRELQQAGVLAEPITLRVVPTASLDASIVAEAERSFPSLLRGSGQSRVLATEELYRVLAK